MEKAISPIINQLEYLSVDDLDEIITYAKNGTPDQLMGLEDTLLYIRENHIGKQFFYINPLLWDKLNSLSLSTLAETTALYNYAGSLLRNSNNGDFKHYKENVREKNASKTALIDNLIGQIQLSYILQSTL